MCSDGRGQLLGDKPETFVSRGIFAETLYTTFGFEENGGSRHYFNIATEHPNANAVNALAPLGILDIYKSELDFHPARPVTRGEAAEMMMMAMTVVELPVKTKKEK